jgi:deoxyribose-phosphate aldolase
MTPAELAGTLDHTLLNPTATTAAIEVLCDEAVRWGVATVCVLPHAVRGARARLDALSAHPSKGHTVGLCAVVGFPLGANRSAIKAAEAALAFAEGATEVDMVINLGAIKSGDWAAVAQDIRAVMQATPPNGRVKVILETALLTDDEKVRATLIAIHEGAHFIKTSTGTGPGGATIDDVRLLRKTVGSTIGVKASGGIATLQDALDMLAAGADRLGTSQSVTILGQMN